MAGEIYLTLATGTDRWKPDGSNHTLKDEGTRWWMVTSFEGKSPLYVVLKDEVAEWCWDNIGPYRIVEHIPGEHCGPDEDDSWRIEFKSDRDATLFKTFWM